MPTSSVPTAHLGAADARRGQQRGRRAHRLQLCVLRVQRAAGEPGGQRRLVLVQLVGGDRRDLHPGLGLRGAERRQRGERSRASPP